MSAPRYARLASKALARVDTAPASPPDADERARAIAAVALEIASRARTRRLWRSFVAGGAAAAVVLAALGVFGHLVRRAAPIATAPIGSASAAQIIAHPVGGGSKVVVSGAQGPLDDDRALPAGSRVVTPANGRAMLSFSTGTSVLLREGADMTVAAEGSAQVLRLEAGSVDLHVAKLGPDERFRVDTSDSQIEVRGTKFRVSIVAPELGCGAGTRTRVAVTGGGRRRAPRWPRGARRRRRAMAGRLPAARDGRAAGVGGPRPFSVRSHDLDELDARR